MKNKINIQSLDGDKFIIYASLFFIVIRLISAATSGLSADEAHYALYGYHLALSYFDHPPLVGWLFYLAELVSSSDLALRIIPIFISAIIGWQLYILANQLFPSRNKHIAVIAFLLYQAMFVGHFLSLGLIPDSILILLTLLIVKVTIKINQRNKLIDWVCLGILFGFAGLAKYTAILLVIGLILFLIFEGKLGYLYSIKPYVSALLALLIISPVIIWNFENNWISFAYQLKHGTGSLDWGILRFLKSSAAQLIAYGPLNLYLGLAILAKYKVVFSSENARFLLYYSLPILAVFAWNSGYSEALPHWTSPGWILLTPLLAHLLSQMWSIYRHVRILTYISSIYSILMIFIFYSHFISPWIEFPKGKDSLAGEIRGWQQAADMAVAIRDEQGRIHDKKVDIYIGSWTLASRLAWYARPEPIIVLDGRYDQFDIWFGSPQSGADVIYVWWSLFPYPKNIADISAHFSDCQYVDSYKVKYKQRELTEFQYYYCQGLRTE